MLLATLAIGATWCALAAALGILIGRGIRAGDRNLDYDTADGYAVPHVDLAQQVSA